MVQTALTIEREIEDARSIQAAGTSEKRENQPSSCLRKRQRTSIDRVFQGRGRGHKGQGQARTFSHTG